jgi:2'-5' RNA ligase
MPKRGDHSEGSGGPKPIRVFVAVDLPQDVRQALKTAQDELRAHRFEIRWVKPENIHLTLKFLGDTLPADLARIGPALRSAAAAAAPFALAARGAGVFPGIKAPRVVWAGLGNELPALFALQQSVAQVLAKAGFAPEARPFKAHLTLGRVKGRIRPAELLAALQALGQWTSPAFRVESVTVFQSDLRPGGAVYTPLDVVPLNKRTTDQEEI